MKAILEVVKFNANDVVVTSGATTGGNQGSQLPGGATQCLPAIPGSL